MTDNERRVPLAEGRNYVQRVLALIAPYCQRYEIAGSIRRGKETVKDAEIVVIPAPGLLAHLDMLVAKGQLLKALYSNGSPRWGEKYRGVALPDVPDFHIELFTSTAQSWGYQLWLRTGPGDANTRVMTIIKLRHAPVRFEAGAAWWGERLLNVRDEHDLFYLLGLPYIEPSQRSIETYRPHFNNGHKWPIELARLVYVEAERYAAQDKLFEVRSAPQERNTIKAQAMAHLSFLSVTSANAHLYGQQVNREALKREREKLARFESGRVVVNQRAIEDQRRFVACLERMSA